MQVTVERPKDVVITIRSTVEEICLEVNGVGAAVKRGDYGSVLYHALVAALKDEGISVY